MIKSFPTLLLLLLVLSLASEARSGVIFTDHGYAGTYFEPYLNEVVGDNVDTGLVDYEWGSASVADKVYHNYAHAAASASASSLLRAYASVPEDNGVAAAAAWRDVVFASSTPDALRLTFSVDFSATVGLFDAPFSSAGTSIGIGIATDLYIVEDWFNHEWGYIGYPFYAGGAGYANSQSVAAFDEDPFRITEIYDNYYYGGSWDTPSSLRSTLQVDVPYDSSIGGYAFAVGLHAAASAVYGTATMDAFHTLSLDSVTLTDGTPVDVTFDSGLTFSNSSTSPVPEPASLALFGIGFLGLLVVRGRKSVQHAA